MSDKTPSAAPNIRCVYCGLEDRKLTLDEQWNYGFTGESRLPYGDCPKSKERTPWGNHHKWEDLDGLSA